ncbi:hypothetical protein ANCCEY_05799 [Ancylostoma ceylanicum]|uniref:RAVE complex protein Rav1 C-terminal domain-containing protein n=1 Tax=Ancylostoma ceylanicum TaxID=53326 RepID=A0A0D6LST6_9BILA|nr:hypothetical protein ANCCEY_05799 [Ancylostoma ceylanicum]
MPFKNSIVVLLCAMRFFAPNLGDAGALISFQVCAVGSDVVILGADFSRVQVCAVGSDVVILGADFSRVQIAATYGNIIRVFEPTNVAAERGKPYFNYQWVETQCFTVKEQVNAVLWNMDGLRMTVVIGDELFLYQHRSLSCMTRSGSSVPVMFCIAEDEQSQDACNWDIVWSVQLAQRPKYIKFSTDGTFLAVAGENDYLVKIFYQESSENDTREQLSFGFVTLHHPAPVRGLEWRRTGRYMPRKCIQAVLMTWCEDNTSRIWKETPPPELAMIDLSGDGGEPSWEKNRPRKFFGKHFRVKKTRNKIINKLKGIVPEKKRRGEEPPHALGLRAQIGKSPSFSDLQAMHHAYTNIQFHLAATINAETDCMLVPSMENGGVLQKPLCVHWLNNKELVFSIGAEKLLAEALISESDPSRRSANVSPCENTENEHSPSSPNFQLERGECTANAFGSVCSDTPSSKDILDVKLEILLRQWTRSNDILFTVHPVDGSLLTWTVEWLDDLHRQPIVSFTSRFPSAFPITDASSLHPTLNTFNPHEPMYVDVLRRDEGRDGDAESPLNDRMLERRISNTIHVLTNHENGSLNLWHMVVDENSNFTIILNITHMSRMCGHRFQINQEKRALSEVILWKISPVGPLCKSGGVKELARVASPFLAGCTLGTVCNSPSSCFIASDGRNLVIYQAVVDARGLLAEIYNSTRQSESYHEEYVSLMPLLIFRSKQICNLRMAATPTVQKPNVGLLQQFNVVSTQSTAKPGCVLEVGKIVDAVSSQSQLILLHIFPERLVIEDADTVREDGQSRMGSVVDRSKAVVFNDRYFVVMVERGPQYESFITYSLVISSHYPQPIPHFDPDTPQDENGYSLPSFAHSVAKLSFTSEKVCEQRVPLPSDVHVISAVPAAGHLPSSSLYPACQAPYVLVTSSDDDVVRFWRCVNADPESSFKYEWREWNMISDNRPSELELEGTILSVSAAHSGRFACAYDPKAGCMEETHNIADVRVEIGVFECESSGGVEWMREDTFNLKNIRIPNMSSFACLPSPLQGSITDLSTSPRTDSLPFRMRSSFRATIKDMVRLDWVSTEDGSHILTAGVAANIYMYTQVSLDPAQQNVALMKESETIMRRPSLRKASSLVAQSHPHSRLTRWVCTRVLELHSADGLPPVPTTLGWARDGLLIVGMQSEMRVYNQWNLQQRSNEDLMTRRETNPQILTLAISQSHSTLDQLQRKKDMPTSKSRLFLDLMNKTFSTKEANSSMVLDALSGEGLFEAARLTSPILPQYHPKQLIVLLNAGKTKRVKAILLHVLTALKQRQVSMHNPLSRAASMRRMSTVDGMEDGTSEGCATRSINFDEDSPDYYEIDDIAPLPLHALVTADTDRTTESGEKAEAFGGNDAPKYDSLFSSDKLDESDLDEMLRDNDSSGRSRTASASSDHGPDDVVHVVFTARHNRLLTELLTHTHLPGLSSVDQMHLLAIADTLSHFSTDVMDKLTQANAAMQPAVPSVLGDATAGGYATAASGIETVDECGLRYLMAMKQHEYLLVCLPMKQRVELKKIGLASSDIIWAQHSETETELLNAVPGLQKSNPTWEELRSLGVAWWLKNTASLKICVEKLAKAAFQQNQDPMDSSLYYLSLRKKNVLTHLFKTVRNQQMADFFMQDFNTEHWRKVAAKNAFVLMSKQRFQHAAAFFLLSGSLKDAIQTILCKCHDLQLAMVVLRLYESDFDAQQKMLKEMLCREVLGQSPDEFEQMRGNVEDDSTLSPDASRDPFIRSMTYWLLKDYSRAAHTLVQEAHRDRASLRTRLSDIFNFYSFLRKHPLVVRQRLTDAGAQVGSTEQFLAVGKQHETLVTPSERRLYFRTAAEHMAHGCPMLALDVLSRLPKNISMVKDGSLKTLLGVKSSTSPVANSVDDVDWSKPTNVMTNEDLSLNWSDDDEDLDEYGDKIVNKATTNGAASLQVPVVVAETEPSKEDTAGTPDVIAQHLKFVASLRILTEELSTLASGFEVDGGQLRFQLLIWLEKEVEVLKDLCDYRSNSDNVNEDNDDDLELDLHAESSNALHEAIRNDRADIMMKLKFAARRRRSFTSYCALHSAQNHRLTSALMELLLLLLDVQKDTGVQHLSEPVLDANSFPLLLASVSSAKMFVSSPLSFIKNQCYDLLSTIADLTSVPDIDNHVQKAYMLYNLSQGLSSSLYQSLCDLEHFPAMAALDVKPGALTRRTRTYTLNDGVKVTTPPSRWPGVDNLVALLSREKDDEAPHLRQLLAECFVAITMSLFCFALAVYDSRWLYRLAAHQMDAVQFSLIFGGGGEKKLKAMPPVRPPRPSAPRTKKTADAPPANCDAQSLRSKLHSKVFGAENTPSGASSNRSSPVLEQTVTKWVPPQKNIVQYLADKPPADTVEELGVDFDSDVDSEGSTTSDLDDDRCENANPTSYAWQLLRLALVEQQIYRIRQFLMLAGFDPNGRVAVVKGMNMTCATVFTVSDVPGLAPRVEAVLRLLDGWSLQLRHCLQSYRGGCPIDLLPNMALDLTESHLNVTSK